jgi:hypothetical protein
MAMVNNAERIRPFGDDPASESVESARSARTVTGLDEGRAWRHRDSGSLVVLRSEVYADEAPGAADAHRRAWHEHGERALDATWRQRWRERDREPGWIEARWVRHGGGAGRPDGPPLDPWCDWLRIEDHTPPPSRRSADGGDGAGVVTVYEHVTVWAPRRQVTVVLRHDVGLDLDDVVVRCAAEVGRRLGLRIDGPGAGVSRRWGLRRGSA